MSRVTAIWAQGVNGVIGLNGKIPWDLHQDMAYFKAMTMGASVIMGRKTWESIPAKFRPLVGRVNIVLTKTPGYEAPGALVVDHPGRALDIASHNPEVYIIGGANVYGQLMWFTDRLLVTETTYDGPGDAYAPEIRESEWDKMLLGAWEDQFAVKEGTVGSTGLSYRFVSYRRKTK